MFIDGNAHPISFCCCCEYTINGNCGIFNEYIEEYPNNIDYSEI